MSKSESISFNHQEQLTVSLISPQHAQIEIETTSTLQCRELEECKATISPLRSDIFQFLVSNTLLTRLRWDSSSVSANSLSLMTRQQSPSGVNVIAEFNETVRNSTMIDLLQDLVDQRIILAPLASISQRRLHRYTHHDDKTYTVNLPMDGALVTSEAMLANLPGCGLLASADADSWSDIMLGTNELSTTTRRKYWMEISKECVESGKQCVYVMKQGIQYGKLWNGSQLSLGATLPGTKLKVCPWTNDANVKVVTPKSITPEILGNEISTSYTDLLRMSFHTFPTNLSAPLVIVEDHFSWNDITYGRIDRSIYTPRGVTYGGIIETTIENLDSFETSIQLFSVIPSYIRLSNVELSIVPYNQTYHVLGKNSFLLEHDFILPSMSKAVLTLQYDPILLSFQLFPPDPNRGNELPPSWAVWNKSETLYSHPQLLLPPVPDMSMPFNVISLTCTFYVFVIGSIINTLVRKGEDKVVYKLYPEKQPESVKEKLKKKIVTCKEKVESIFSTRKCTENVDNGVHEENPNS